MATVERNQSKGAVVGLVAIALGAAVAVALGVYGNQHTPTGRTITTFGFGSLIAMKVWLGACVGALALVQLATALVIYGRLGRWSPPWAGVLHRVSGAAAIIVSLPVAFHCLWSLGYQSEDTRVLVHSLVGCVVYGAFVTKILVLHAPSTPRWMLPIAGGLLFSAVVVVVLTSSVWYLAEFGTPPSGSPY